MNRRIFVRCPNWLGDIIMSIPAIRALKQIFPEYEIWGYVRKEYAKILKRVDAINDLIPFEKKNILNEIINNVQLIKSINFEKAVVFPNSWTSALLPFLSGIPERYGYKVRNRTFFFTNPVELSEDVKNLHQVYYYLGIIRAIKDGSYEDKPVLIVKNEEVINFKKKYELENKKLCCFVAGAAFGPAKCWFKERYIELGKKLVNMGFHIILVGSKDDVPRCNEIADGIGSSTLNLAGKTSIEEVPVIMKSCNFTISNDSGPMHVSSAVNTPVIGIFGSTNPKTTYPFGYRDLVIHKEIECSYCLDRECKLKINKMRCMELITVQDILDKLEEKGLLNG